MKAPIVVLLIALPVLVYSIFGIYLEKDIFFGFSYEEMDGIRPYVTLFFATVLVMVSGVMRYKEISRQHLQNSLALWWPWFLIGGINMCAVLENYEVFFHFFG